MLFVAFIVLLGWSAMTALTLATDFYLRRSTIGEGTDPLARKHVTQVRVLRRVTITLVSVVTIAAALMTFDSVKQYGVSLIASAGAAGIVVGLALRPLLTNLFAGIQLAVTQPIRIGDAVIVENEWGWVEEITGIYVVIKLWDGQVVNLQVGSTATSARCSCARWSAPARRPRPGTCAARCASS
jgi:small-conductance mechanosensitive channel